MIQDEWKWYEEYAQVTKECGGPPNPQVTEHSSSKQLKVGSEITSQEIISLRAM
jgi:hypothetical protein